MTWAEFKILVKDRLQYDGQSDVDLNNLGIASVFNLRALVYLQTCVQESYALYADRATLTLAAADKTVNTLDIAKCSQPIWQVGKVWINSIALAVASMSDLDLLASAAAPAQGTPIYFSVIGDGKIFFDKPCTAGLTNCFASGWRLHSTISSDSQVMEFPDSIAPAFADYVAAQLSKAVVADQLGLNRLQMYSESSYKAITEFAAKQKARYYAYRAGRGA